MGKSKDLATGNSAAYVETAGDTMTGHLGVGGDPVPSASNYNNAVIHARQAGSSSVGSQLRLTTGATGHAAGDGSFISQWADSGLYITNQEAAHIAFSTGGSERVRIDASGRVLTPSQPNFFAYTSTDYTSTGLMTGGSNWGEAYDAGNNFSAGTFTAPVTGKYLFSVMWDANSIQSTIYMRKNNVDRIKYEPTGRTDNSWESHHYSAMIELSANDYVTLYLNMHSQSSSYPAHMGSVGQWGHFAGYLIG